MARKRLVTFQIGASKTERFAEHVAAKKNVHRESVIRNGGEMRLAPCVVPAMSCRRGVYQLCVPPCGDKGGLATRKLVCFVEEVVQNGRENRCDGKNAKPAVLDVSEHERRDMGGIADVGMKMRRNSCMQNSRKRVVMQSVDVSPETFAMMLIAVRNCRNIVE